MKRRVYKIVMEAIVRTEMVIVAPSEEAAYDKATQVFFGQTVRDMDVDNREMVSLEVAL